MEEFLDIVDDNDNVIAKDTRENIYEGGLKNNVRVVNIFLFNSKGELLVPKRSENRRLFPGCYDFSCGEHVISGENYYSAAIRGLKEELKLSNLKLLELGKLMPKDGVNCFMKVFKVIYDGKINYDHESIESINFYSLETVRKMLNETPNKFKPDFEPVFRIFFDL
jgi:isopentenyl-diphosphate delta-isomerase